MQEKTHKQCHFPDPTSPFPDYCGATVFFKVGRYIYFLSSKTRKFK